MICITLKVFLLALQRGGIVHKMVLENIDSEAIKIFKFQLQQMEVFVLLIVIITPYANTGCI